MRISYRTKIHRTKLSKFWLGVENFVRRKILSVENFVQCCNTNVKQKSDKILEISAWCRKFYPTKFCPIRYVILNKLSTGNDTFAINNSATHSQRHIKLCELVDPLITHTLGKNKSFYILLYTVVDKNFKIT